MRLSLLEISEPFIKSDQHDCPAIVAYKTYQTEFKRLMWPLFYKKKKKKPIGNWRMLNTGQIAFPREE